MIGRRGLGRLLKVLGGLVTGGVVLAGVAIWRLASAPITVTALTPYLIPPLEALADGVHIEVGKTVLSWGGVQDPLVLRLRDVRIAAADQSAATIPELAVELSARALVQGRVALASVTVVGPTLRLVRSGNGTVALDSEAADSSGHALPAAAGVLDLLGQPTEGAGPLGTLVKVAVVGAVVTIDDRVTGILWSVPAASLEVQRGAAGLRAAGRLEVRLPGGSARLALEAQGVRDAASGAAATTATVRFEGLDPSGLALAMPSMPALAGIHLPLAGRLGLGFDRDFGLLSATLTAFDAEGGTVDLPTLHPGPIEVAALAVTAAYDAVQGRLVLDHARLEASSPVLTLEAKGEVGGLFKEPAGTLHGALECGAPGKKSAGPMRFEAQLGGGAGRALSVRIGGLEPARLAALAPALAPLAGIGVPVGGVVDIGFDSAWRPARVALDLSAGPGRLVLPQWLPDAVPLSHLALAAEVQAPFWPVPGHLEVKKMIADFGGPRLSLTGTVARAGDGGAAELFKVTGDVAADAVPVPSLPRLWPPRLGANAREWITTNMKAGLVDHAWLHVDGQGPVANPAEISTTSLDGGVDGSNFTVNYFKALTPIVGISGHGTTDGRSFVLVTTGGHIGDLTVGDGRVEITKLDTKQEWIDIEAPLSGPIRTTLTVLDMPPLRYGHRIDVDPSKTEGSQSGHVHFYFPLKKDIDIEDIDIGVTATLHGAQADSVAGGIKVGEGELKLTLNGAGMDVAGTARLEDVPWTVQWRENFDDGVEPRTKVELRGDVTDADVTRRGLEARPYMIGHIGAGLHLTVDHAKHLKMLGDLDLAPVRLTLEPLGWIKPAGTPGSARFKAEFDRGRLVGYSGIAVETNGLSATGSVDMTALGGVGRVRVDRLRLGANDFGVDVHVRPGNGYDVVAQGPVFDARPLLGNTGDAQAKQEARALRLVKRGHPPPPPGPPYRLAFDFGRAISGADRRGFTDLKGEAVTTGRGFDRIVLDAGIAGSEAALALRYLPDGDGRRLTLTSGEAGALLHAMEDTDSIQGGRLAITATGPSGFPSQPLAGHMEVGDYRLVGAPLLARVLHALSVTGLMEALNGEGLSFSQLESDFAWDQDVLTLKGLRTAGGALGLTLAGKLDLAAASLDVEGTIVPVYSLNRILGMVPLVGDMLSGGAGQGVFAATYYLSGPITEPKVSVNALAALAPGFLRNLFFLDSGAKSPP